MPPPEDSGGAPAGPPPSDPRVPSPGDLLAGKYRVERVLGAGGMGVVLLARHLDLDEPVAIKLLLPHVPLRGEPLARFVREARAAARIKSEHVVRVLDTGRLPTGAPFIVMEYLQGRDLAHVLEDEGPMPIDAAVDLVLQACEAIAAAHAAGVVHRDLKPANLFLATANDGTPCLKVLDFGISKLADPKADPRAESSGGALTSTETIMGTPCFMSPEQLRSTRDVDARTDVWSLGAILYALLAGKPPFDGESSADVSAKIIRDTPPPLDLTRPDVPAGLRAVIERCLEKDVNARFDGVPALAQALAAVGPPEASTAAARIVRIASAPRSTPEAVGSAGLALVPPMPIHLAPTQDASDARAPLDVGPTRTASSWSDSTRDAEPAARRTRGRRRIFGLSAAGAGAIAAFGVVVILTAQRSVPLHTASSGAQVAARVTPPPEHARASAAPPPSAPSAEDPASGGRLPGGSAPIRTGLLRPAASPSDGHAGSGRPAAKPSATASPRPGMGLFNERD